MNLSRLLDPGYLISTWGTVGVIAVIFAETGLLIGFFLPGDSLLVTAGILASGSSHCVGGHGSACSGGTFVHIDLAILLPGVFVAAVLGAESGYLIGRRAGPALLDRPDSRWFKREHVVRTEEFFSRRGSSSIVLARFVPVVRTFANVVAGVGHMDGGAFAVSNVVGALLWSVGVTLLGYGLGSSVAHIDRYLLPVIGLIILASLVPVLLEIRRSRRRRAAS
ncbi:MAG: DedA family protein [Acidimicrobiales bacterium]